MAVLIMAQQTKPNNASATHQQQQQPEAKAIFHDFLGMKATTDSPVVLPHRNADASPSASASVGVSSAGGRGPISTTSDLASDIQVGNHLEGIPFYGPRSDISGPEISNRLTGSKRSNSESVFMGSARDGIPQMGHDSIDGLHLMKAIRPTSASLMLQNSAGSRLDANLSKWERSIPVGAAVQYPRRGGQFVPLTHQVSVNRFRDTNAGPSIISQSAADEGSRTGIKGPGILSSINAGSGVSEKTSSAILPSGSKLRSGTHISEPESSTPSSRQGLTSASRQMTIFYGGQAHVFDDVHPNKADVIMALAGSNGGSWSTTYSPKPTTRQGGESFMTGAEYGAGVVGNTAFQREFCGRLSSTGNTTQGVGSSDRISAGGHHGNTTTIAKVTRNPVQAGEPSSEEKREV